REGPGPDRGGDAAAVVAGGLGQARGPGRGAARRRAGGGKLRGTGRTTGVARRRWHGPGLAAPPPSPGGAPGVRTRRVTRPQRFPPPRRVACFRGPRSLHGQTGSDRAVKAWHTVSHSPSCVQLLNLPRPGGRAR